MENKRIVELAIGKVKEGVSREQYFQAATAVEPDLRRMPGFQKRALAAGEDRLWVDRVWWASQADADQGHTAFEHLDSGKEMESLLDPQTVTMYQLEPVFEDVLAAEPSGANPVVELVISRVKEGVTREDYLRAAQAVEPDLRCMSGFLSRQLLLDPEGLWFDIVNWRSMDEALAAAEAFMKLDSAQPINTMLDPETLRMYHLEQVFEDARQADLTSLDN